MNLSKNRGKSTIKNLLNLWKFINRRRKRQLIYLLILMNIYGIMEIFTLTAVIPFFNILLNPERVLENKFIIFQNSYHVLLMISQVHFAACLFFFFAFA